MKPFKDTSIFQNVKEYADDTGRQWRAQWFGGKWSIYLKRGSGFAFHADVCAPSSADCKKIHSLARV